MLLISTLQLMLLILSQEFDDTHTSSRTFILKRAAGELVGPQERQQVAIPRPLDLEDAKLRAIALSR